MGRYAKNQIRGFPRQGEVSGEPGGRTSDYYAGISFSKLEKGPGKRKKFLVSDGGGGVSWDSCPEVIHIEQILGNYQNYSHEKQS